MTATSGPGNQLTYLFGGYHSGQDLRCNESNHEIDQVAHLPSVRSGSAAICDPKKQVGFDFQGEILSDILRFEPETGKFVNLSIRLSYDWGSTVVFAGDGNKVYVCYEVME